MVTTLQVFKDVMDLDAAAGPKKHLDYHWPDDIRENGIAANYSVQACVVVYLL